MRAGIERGPIAVQRFRATDQGLFFFVDDDDDEVVDVLFDGRRVWSFWTLRDSEESGAERVAAWPGALRRFLDGRVRLSLVDHVCEAEVAATEAVLGSGEGTVAVVDKQGRPLGLDKSLTLSRLFDSRDPEHLAPLLDSIDTVLRALHDSGIEAFVAYGTLLGAVREGGLIGHDSDADLGYVSRYDHPADVICESFRLQRQLSESGLSVTRYSGLAFRVNLVEGDGVMRGLDVFGGFMRQGRLYLMGEVGTPFREEWVRPLGTVTLEGREYAAPAAPERLLEATYGPHWRTPDPAFKFETPQSTVRRLDGWFRGTRGGRNLQWHRPRARELRGSPRPSALAQWVRSAEPEIGTFVDVGCGAGADAYWMAEQGVPARGLDFRPTHYRVLAGRAEQESLPVDYAWANLNELRSVLPAGAALSRLPGPRVVMARHVVDTVDASGRANFLRLAEMTVRGSGRLYLQVARAGSATPRDEASGPEAGGDDASARGLLAPGRDNLRPQDVDALTGEIEARGGRVEAREDLVESAVDEPQGGGLTGTEKREVTRLVVTWQA
jgi:hypothetical protein